MLEACKISYAHKKFSILENIDVSVNYGELLVIVGPNGAGKSTLLSMLANEMKHGDEPIMFKKKTLRNGTKKSFRCIRQNFHSRTAMTFL